MTKPKPQQFTHLHCHTDRSLLDGVGRSIEYADMAARAGHTHLAITDHGQLYGLPEHRRACKEKGLKAIYGCELYVNDKRADKQTVVRGTEKTELLKAGTLDPTFTDSHLVVLCKDRTGWKNLLKINHDSVLNGYYFKPRTDHEFVCQHAEGLYATTACLGSQFSQYIMLGRTADLRKLLGQFKDAFGDRFFVELHINEAEEQKQVNEILAINARDMGIEPIFACDVHYACKDDVNRQDEMTAISRRNTLNDPDAFKMSARNLWFCNPAEAFALGKSLGYNIDMRYYQRAVDNTANIARDCDCEIYDDGTLKPPTYLDEQGRPVADSFATLRTIAVAGFKELFLKRIPASQHDHYRARFLKELKAIKLCGMEDFYLVTMDVMDQCRRRGIFAWTRGSGCASLVGASVGISAFDPMPFDLLFERFVDPSRPNAPDFDLDIDASRKQEIVDWFVLKYGGTSSERIARILTLQTFGLKAAIRDVCMTHELQGAFRISELADKLPDSVEKSLASCTVAERPATIDSAITELRKVADAESTEFINIHPIALRAALTMVGRVRGRSLHAAGYVVAPDALINHLPIDKTGDDIVSAWGEGQASQDIGGTGLMKIDFLSLDTCTVIANTCAMASKLTGRNVLEEINAYTLDYTDEKVLREYCIGNGLGLHQLAETHQQLAQFIQKLKPTSVFEITAAIAMYRPGAMDFMEEFLLRARGRLNVPAVHPIFDAITAETYGILVYQEQIMRVLHEMGDIPLREAYSVIKSISKKKIKEIQKSRAAFIANAQANHQLAQADAEGIFDIIEKFAGYGFNKAHSASYAVLSWITAYLRAHYPTAFWWAWLNCVPNKAPKKGAKVDTRKIEVIMRAVRQAGITLRPPMIGHSKDKWRVLKDGSLLAPLSIVLGVGERSAKLTNEAYRKAPWRDFWEFLNWAEKHKQVLNKNALALLAKAGAFNGLKRWDYAGNDLVTPEYAHDLITVWSDYKATKQFTQTDQLQSAVTNGLNPFLTLPDAATRTVFEKTALGFAFWANPWTVNDRQRKVITLVAEHRIADEMDTGLHGKRRAFYIASIRNHTDKKGRVMAFMQLQTMLGRSYKGVCFGSTWEQVRKGIRPDRVYLIRGDHSGGDFIVGNVMNGESPFRDLDNLTVTGT